MAAEGKSQQTPSKLYPKEITRNHHSMRKDDLSQNTLKVIEGLLKHNYEAYAVGGCIRDRLLGSSPKDFDVVTNATPEQIKACFRNCRLIGRRFRLAHITFGRDIIEVATFRGHHGDETQDANKLPKKTNNREALTNKKLANVRAHKSDSGQLLRDNIFGSIEEDAARRDFTFNAMYFDIRTESILDFANGIDAIADKEVRMIGPAELRFCEDPVRMLRAIRFACKLNMTLPSDLSACIHKNAHLLTNIPPARLFEEVSKLLLSGQGWKTFLGLYEHNLMSQLFPLLTALLRDKTGKEYQLVEKMLKNTDNRINNDQRITPAFLYAAFLWYPMEERAQELMFESAMPHHDAINVASSEILTQQCRKIMIPKRFSIPAKEIWSLQTRLQRRQGKRCLQLIGHPRFRAAYDFLLLRSHAEGGDLIELSQWWTDFQKVDNQEQQKMLSLLPSSRRPRRRNNRRKAQK